MEVTDTEKTVLEALTASTTSVSVVTLAADLWMPHSQNLGADPIGLVQWVIESLGDKGLVNYRTSTHTQFSGHGHPWDGLAMGIRLTRAGWALMGYPLRYVQVHTRMSTSVNLPHQGDLTNFRRHGDSAQGGPIEIQTFREHRAAYPSHVHMYFTEDDTMPDTERRPYVRITPLIEQQIQMYKDQHPGASVTDISDELMYSERTVRYVLYDLPRIRRNSHDEGSDASQKQRILLALRAMDYNNITDLRKTLGRSDTAHDIVHALHDLHTEGKVDFTEQGARKQPIRIHITERGRSSLKTDTVLARLPTTEQQNGIAARIENSEKRPGPDDIVNAGIPFDQPPRTELDDEYADALAELAEANTQDTPTYPLLKELTSASDSENRATRKDCSTSLQQNSSVQTTPRPQRSLTRRLPSQTSRIRRRSKRNTSASPKTTVSDVQPRADVAAMRLQISAQFLKDPRQEKLLLLRMMREILVREIGALVPGARLHFMFSKVAPRCYDMTALASEDDARALDLATKMRKTRRQWYGYRTDWDWMQEDTDVR